MKKLISILLLISALTFCLASCTCEKCDGDGMVFCEYCLGEGESSGIRCDLCEGDGECAYCDGGKYKEWMLCTACYGKGCSGCKDEGWIVRCVFCDDNECFKCDGTGYAEEPTTCVYCNGIGERPCVKCNN